MNPEVLGVKLGRLQIANPTILASGVQGASLSKVLDALSFGAGAAVTKSIGPAMRTGYSEPTLAEVDSGWVNAVGLPNPGAAMFSEELAEIEGRSLPVIVSIFGGDELEFRKVAATLDNGDFVAFELNLSCPHVSGVGTEVGHFPELVSEVVKEVKSVTDKPVFAKLSPNTERLIEVAGAAIDAGAEGLTAINTVRAMYVDIGSGKPSLSNRYGGLSGGAVRPIALRCVYELREEFDVPIIGCGGVSTWEHAVQFLLAGANAVQIGSATFGNLALFNDINLGIMEYMEAKGVKGLDDLVGGAHSKGESKTQAELRNRH